MLGKNRSCGRALKLAFRKFMPIDVVVTSQRLHNIKAKVVCK